MKGLFGALLARYRAHRTVAWLAASAYGVNASRAAAALLVRLVLDPMSVGIVNGITMLTTLLAPLSVGSIYGALRALPGAPEVERPRLVARAFAASAIEALVVALLVAPLALPFIVPVAFGTALFWLALAVTVITRLLAIQESILMARAEFGIAIRTRTVRAFEPLTGVAGAALSATPFAYLLGSSLTGIASLAWRRRAYFPPGLGFRGFWREGFALLRGTDKYSWQVSLDRMAITVANYIDAAVVVVISGPASLAGYYLGVNIRGVMSNVPTAIFWQRWSSSVAAFDNSGVDRYTSARFLWRLWLVMATILVAGCALLWFAVKWLIPAYQPHFEVAALAAVLALPIGLSAMLRGRRLLDKRVGLLVWFSVARIAIFIALLAAFGRERIAADQTLIALAGYIAVATECLINAGDIAMHLKRPRLLLLVAALVGIPGLAFLL